MASPIFPDLPEDDDPGEGERMWPLDVALLALGGLILYLAVDRLEFDDPRWQYNAWTYVALVPTAIAAIAFLLHKMTGKFLQRSVQLGVLVSVFVHLLLMIVAVNVIIFSRYFPDTFTGFQPDRAPIRKTVPDHLFQHQTEATTEQADWTKPVDSETASRIVPEEMRELPPQEKAASRLEMPTEEPQKEPELKKFLIERQQAEETAPSPNSDPSRLARREIQTRPELPSRVEAPLVPPAETASPQNLERTDLQAQRAASAGARVDLPTPDPQRQPTVPQRQLELRPLEGTPRTGETAMEAPRRVEVQRRERMSPAGAAPIVPSYSVAQQDPSASHVLRPDATPNSRATQNLSSSLADLGLTGPAPNPADSAASVTGAVQGTPVPQSGVPQISPGTVARSSGRAALDRANSPPLPAGPPNPSANRSTAEAAESTGVDDGPQLAQADGPGRRNLDTAGLPAPALAPMTPAIKAEPGPDGLAKNPSPLAGLRGMPEIPSETLGLGRRPVDRKKVGGPMTPAGSEVASVESFQNRVMRTSGGAAPAPEGMVGPETEQAIELGLAYLAERQNADGSWSLASEKGERVLLKSDTAATGLALLAFQGAGYTHRQHQYASVLAKGFDFLLRNQRENGDLFRPEDSLSNQNVWLYSHAIAALALCEGYGMTQDPELEEPAQRAIDFIADSQHPSRGGWRYRPRNSSDTSVSGWMTMALKSGELSGLRVPEETYEGINQWLRVAQESPSRGDRYRYNPYAPNNDAQRHGREVTRTMTAVAMLMRMYSGWEREDPMMQSAADFIAAAPPAIGQRHRPLRDTYYWYYATQVMFYMGGEHWKEWNRVLTPLLVDSQQTEGELAGSWDPRLPVPDRWSPHGGRLYVTTMNLLSLEVYYRHLPLYEETAHPN